MRLLLGVLWLFLVGCESHGRYLINRSGIDALAAMPSEIAAVRESDRKSVYLHGFRFRRLSAPEQDPVLIEVRGHNPLLSAGVALTFIGTAVSLIGTGLFAAGNVQKDAVLFDAGGIVALAAEPIMLTGTLLWIFGALRPPYESRVRRPPPSGL